MTTMILAEALNFFLVAHSLDTLSLAFPILCFVHFPVNKSLNFNLSVATMCVCVSVCVSKLQNYLFVFLTVSLN